MHFVGKYETPVQQTLKANRNLHQIWDLYSWKTPHSTTAVVNEGSTVMPGLHETQEILTQI